MSKDKEEFNKLLLDAINESLTQVFGQNAARSVTFYIDPNIAVANAGNYARSLEKLFGPGAKLVLDTVLVSLSQKTGVPGKGSKNFGDAVVEVSLTFQKTE